MSGAQKADGLRPVVDAGGHAIANIRVERNNGDAEAGEIWQLTVGGLAREVDIETLRIEPSQSDTTILKAYKRW